MDIQAYLNFDMMGYTIPGQPITLGVSYSDEPLKSLRLLSLMSLRLLSLMSLRLLSLMSLRLLFLVIALGCCGVVLSVGLG